MNADKTSARAGEDTGAERNADMSVGAAGTSARATSARGNLLANGRQIHRGIAGEEAYEQ